MMAAQMKKTDPRVVRTQRLLRKAMFELMEEREFEHITVQDIADRATIKRATFYLHFNDKQDLVHQCISELLEELHNSMEYSQEELENFDFTSREAHPSFIRLFHHIAEHYDQYQALLVKNRIPALSTG
ncbi:TetR/AcrR family transcriptional regulator [Paenibacillus pini]|uniref:TetR family regulatory protein n=1 Tax=Paenibacillus pini JCM 16418 TaxID=1236976 RepID=W7YT01_9BACL|nr:TetR/AcrR family transcriptional regulator [Paenibacillus pini]GAF07771.1 TetR family regulatory protein [Paenibacillus pini JCM 16418]